MGGMDEPEVHEGWCDRLDTDEVESEWTLAAGATPDPYADLQYMVNSPDARPDCEVAYVSLSEENASTVRRARLLLEPRFGITNSSAQDV